MKRIAAFVISVMMICLSGLSASAVDYMFSADTVSDAVYLENLSAGAVVYEKNSDKRSYPASTTKIMTFIITAENVGDLEHTEVTVRQELLDGLDPESTMMGLSEHIGEKVSVRDLLYGLMLPSGNDAALVLADYVGGGIAGFVEKMNAKAAELGCANTHFANPHGLYDAGHYSTARDMALITKYAMTLPDFMEICGTVYYTPAGFNTLHNTNYMIDPEAEGGSYYYEYTRGIKTGYLDEAGKCLVTSSDKDGDQYLYGSLGVQTIFSPEDGLASVDVKYVRNGKTLSAVPGKAITAFLPNQYDKSKLKVEVSCAEQVEAPVAKGDVLGTVSVRYEDLDLGVTDLLAAEDVERDISPLEAFITEHMVLVIILTTALLLILVSLIALLSSRSSRKRRKARHHSRARKGQRFRD